MSHPIVLAVGTGPWFNSPNLPGWVTTEIITVLIQSVYCWFSASPILCRLFLCNSVEIPLWPGWGAPDSSGPWVDNRLEKNLDSNPIPLGGRQTPIFSFPEHPCSLPTRLGWSGGCQTELGPGRSHFYPYCPNYRWPMAPGPESLKTAWQPWKSILITPGWLHFLAKFFIFSPH